MTRTNSRTRFPMVALALLVAALTLSGCAASRGPVYPRGQAYSAWNVQNGRVVDIESATIEGRRSRLGRIGGGWIGYEVARTIGSGSGSRIAGAVGGVAGAVAGGKVEQAATRQDAYAITVELDGGRTIQVVQPADQPFAVGEDVRVYTRRDQARVGKR